MNRMDQSEATAYRGHLAHCQGCAKAVEDARDYVRALKDARREFEV